MSREEPFFGGRKPSSDPDSSEIQADGSPITGKPKRDPKLVLAQLATMRAEGEISAEEFQAAREKILQQLPPSELNNYDISSSDEHVKQDKKTKPEKKKGSNFGAFLVLCLIVGVGFSMCRSGASTPADNAQAAAKTAADRQKGFHCLSSWDGSNSDLVAKVKASLREPSSFEHVETKISPLKDGMHAVFMDYRGRNGFGGMNVETAGATISATTCKVIQWATL